MAVKRNARQPIQVDWETVTAAARIHCTLEEICSLAKIRDVYTLERICKRDKKITLQQFVAREQRYGNAGIRRAQWRLAVEELDGPMLRFLGKQLLGQSDEVTVNLPPADGRFGQKALPTSGQPLVQIIIKTKDDQPSGPTAMALRWYDTPPPEGAAPIADDVPATAKSVEAIVEPGEPAGSHVPRGTTEQAQQGDEQDAPPAEGGPADGG